MNAHPNPHSTMPRTCTRFVRPSFWEGMARALDLTGTVDPFPGAFGRGPAADARALRGDWQMVGAGLRRAAERVRPEVEAARRAAS